MMLRCLFTLVSCLPGLVLSGQDSLVLRPVEISAPREQVFAVGQFSQRFDSATLGRYQGSQLPLLLAQEASTGLKQYSPAGLSTLALRGSAAQHTAVLWNGFPVQSPMNGLLELSLPAFAALDAIHLQYGGSAALYGSGAVGGALHLYSRAGTQEGFHGHLGLGGGSFRASSAEGGLSWRRGKSALSVRGFFQQAANDFVFRGNFGVKQRMPNAAMWLGGGMLNAERRTGKFGTLQIALWHQQSARQIPPGRAAETDSARQADRFWRLSAVWTRRRGPVVLKMRAFGSRESLDYESLSTPLAESRLQNAIAETEASYRLGRQVFHLGLHTQYNHATYTDWQEARTRGRAALWAAWRRSGRRAAYSFALRQEWADGAAQPFTGSGGAEWQLGKHWRVRSTLARSFSLPGFNDLYWPVLGNPNLRPERGLNAELGLQYQAGNWDMQLAHFQILIQDWIQWRPGADGQWRPLNLLEGWSRGLEWRGQWHKKFGGGVQLRVQAQYAYTRASDLKASNEALKGKQLIYVPEHQGSIQEILFFKNWECRLIQRMSGKRYSSADNLSSVAAFGLADLYAAWHKKTFSANLSLQNLFNRQYEIVAFQPMPGIQLQAGLNWRF